MKILYFHQHFATPEGSSGTRSYEFAKALVARGHEVTLVCGASAGSGLQLAEDTRRGWLKGKVDRISVRSLSLSYSNHDHLFKRCVTFLKFGTRSIRIVFSESYDLVFATSTPLTAAIPGIVARVIRRKPFVFEVRDLWPELPRALGMRNPFLLMGMSLLEISAYRASIAAIGLSPGIVKGIRMRSRKDLPVAMIPNGCDLELFHPRLKESLKLPGIEEDDFVAGFTGAHGPANGLDSLLDVAAELKRRGRAHIKLVFIGDGKMKAGLVDRAQREGLNNCLFYAPRPKVEIAKLTASFDVGLMILKDVPAFYYGTSPNKFFDYIASGIPVLNNYPGWLSELIEESHCGMVVPPRNSAAFADALESLAESPESCQKMGLASRQLAESEFPRVALAESFCRWLERKGA